jgi:hypothetical protein
MQFKEIEENPKSIKLAQVGRLSEVVQKASGHGTLTPPLLSVHVATLLVDSMPTWGFQRLALSQFATAWEFEFQYGFEDTPVVEELAVVVVKEEEVVEVVELQKNKHIELVLVVPQ